MPGTGDQPFLYLTERHDCTGNHQQAKLAAAKTAPETVKLKRQAEALDGQLDRLVYGLYGLTDGDITSVETASGAA